MNRNFKVGLLGAGYILDYHAAALRAIPEVTLHAVCDISRSRAQKAAERHGIPHTLASLDELIASDCQVVHVLLPPALHLETAMRLAMSGKSVFLEKPMGLDSDQCAALGELGEHNGVAIGVNHNFLFLPRYESFRSAVRSHAFGRLDHLSVNWHFPLPLLQFGPFDHWILSAPANIVFEVGSHVAAFVVDLAGMPEVLSATLNNPITLPTGQTFHRQWTAVGKLNAATVVMSISTAAGHADRILRLRGRAGSAQFDFGRDIGWTDPAPRENPLFDSYEAAASTAQALKQQATKDRRRRLKAALGKRPGANAFEESILRSIATFYRNMAGAIDPRHDPRFATRVVRLCEDVSLAAHVGPPSTTCISVDLPRPRSKPTVLVVGGAGFIGRRTVRNLVRLGHEVRVLTRNATAAAVDLRDLQIELMTGSHGDPECVKRALQGISVVYHLAKCEGKRWQDYVDGDITPTRVLAEAALAAGVRRFVYTGTIASYASVDPARVIDNATPVDSAIHKRSYYARSKAECEALLQRLHRDHEFPLVILRPGIVIGPGTPPTHLGIAKFSSEVQVNYWGTGRNPLPLVLVDDVADALAKALDAPGIEGATLLVAGPPLLSARDYITALAAAMEAQIDARPRLPWRYWLADLMKELAKNAVRHPNRRWPTLHDWKCQSNQGRYDSRATQKLLNWSPVSDRESLIERGIKDAVEWYLR